MTTIMNRVLDGSVLTALACAAFVGCADADGAAQEEMDRLPASTATTASTGVTTWATGIDDGERTVMGIDADGGVVTRWRAAHLDEDRLALTAPEGAAPIVLARDGAITGATSAAEAALVRALFADSQGRAFTAPSPEPVADVGTDTAALSATLAWVTDYPRGGGLFGYSETFDAGHHCPGGRPRWYYDAYVTQGGGNCYIERWKTDDEHDCSVRLHIGVSAFGGVTCRGLAYIQ
jgi:hypothetical protein